MNFSWHVYLSETGAEVSPSDLFQHVSASLHTFIKKGDVVLMNCAVLNRSQETSIAMSSWWPAEVLTISGSLILFKWCIPNNDTSPDQVVNGHDSVASDSINPNYTRHANVIWFDVKGSNWQYIRPLDWLEENDESLSPPKSFIWASELVRNNWQKSDWFSGLRKRAVPSGFFERQCLYAYEAIKVGGYFECEHEYDPCCVWPVKVLLNVGGRVSLTWFGISSKAQDSKICQSCPSTFTLFYLHRRLHPLGWGKRNGLKYCPPSGYSFDRAISNVDAFLRGACSAFPCDFGKLSDISARTFTPETETPLHEFKVGWKLEAVNPRKPYLVQPATIAKVFNSRYFLVELDDIRWQSIHDSETNKHKSDSSNVSLQSKIQFVGFAGMPEIMPANDSQLRGLHLAAPPGWPASRPFTWTNYLTYLSARKAKSVNHSENDTVTPQSFLSDRMLKCNSPLSQNPDLIPTTGCYSGLSDPLIIDGDSTEQTSGNAIIFCPSEPTFRGIRAPNSLMKSDVHSKNPKSITIDTNCSDHIVRDEDTCSRIDRNEISNPSRFLLGMKLEMVVPNDFIYDRSAFDISPPLCTATVTRVDYPHLLWLLPDVPSNGTHRRRPLMIDSRSTDLYPVGWASSVGHPIIAPAGYQSFEGNPAKMWKNVNSMVDVKYPPTIERPKHELQFYNVRYDCEEMCPPIYINSKCYLGPFLCKSNLELLPRRFGPGPITRVMQYMITRLVRAAYRPTRVLRMLEADWASGIATSVNNLNSIRKHPDGAITEQGHNGRTCANAKAALNQAETEVFEQRRTAMRVVLVTVRCPRRGIKIEAPVEVCCRARAVEEYCRQISLVLEACPHLLSSVPPETLDSNCNTRSQLPTIDRSPGFPFEIMNSTQSHDCPSFCASRLRSRNLDRLPGWKKRSYASLRHNFSDPSSNDQDGSQSLRTRSAVAAAQRQNPSEGFDTDKILQTSGLGLVYEDGCKVFGGRFGSRPKGSAIRRTASGSQLSQEVLESTRLPNPGRGRPKRSLGSSTVRRDTKRRRDSPHAETSTEPVITGNGHSDQSNLSQPLVDSVLMNRCQALVQQQPFASSYRPLWRTHCWPITVNEELQQVVHPVSSYPNRPRLESNNTPFERIPSEIYPNPSNFTNPLFANIPRITLSSNPMLWSPVDLASYLGGTDCREMWPWLAAEAVDGQAFMLLTLPVLHRLVGLRWEDAVRLARHVISVKQAFVEQFCTNSHVTENVFCTKAR